MNPYCAFDNIMELSLNFSGDANVTFKRRVLFFYGYVLEYLSIER